MLNLPLPILMVVVSEGLLPLFGFLGHFGLQQISRIAGYSLERFCFPSHSTPVVFLRSQPGPTARAFKATAARRVL
jgi:hypothetical protein